MAYIFAYVIFCCTFAAFGVFDIASLPLLVTVNGERLAVIGRNFNLFERFLLKNLRMSEKSCNFASKIAKDTKMEAAVKQPIMQYTGTISEEKWANMHTIDELDATLKSIIHNHFHK